MSVDRGFTWMDDEVYALIAIFSKDDVQQELQGSKRNITIFERIASDLSEVGFKRTAYQCREKIKRLRKEYYHTKNCLANNTTPKKPMKYLELVEKLFEKDPSSQLLTKTKLTPTTDEEDELHLTLGNKSENSSGYLCQDAVNLHSVLPGMSSSPMQHEQLNSDSREEFDILTNNSFSNHANNEDTILDEDTVYDLSDKESHADEYDPPWVPSVVLEERDSPSAEIENESDSGEEDLLLNGETNLEDFNATTDNEMNSKDVADHPAKKRKITTHQCVKDMLDSVSETFLKYQEKAEAQFLERIVLLEQERIKRDQNMQKLWFEFEERRRKDEQQHELKIISLFGQFIKQMNGKETISTTVGINE